MDLTRFDRAADFYARAEPFLLRHEAEHNLILGLCTGLIEHPQRSERPPYLATVEQSGTVVLAAVMTPPYNLVLSLTEAPGALSLLAADLHKKQTLLPGVVGPALISRAFAEAWQRTSGHPYHKGLAQRIYQLEAVVPVSGVPGWMRRAVVADRDLLVAWLLAFSTEALGEGEPARAEYMVDARLAAGTGGLFFWCHDEQPVSVAGYAGPTPHGIRVGPVYTPPEQRGRGYASALVAAMSQYLLDEGRTYCFLFTDLSNPTSNHIYQTIGYDPVCDVDEYRFG